MRAFGSDGSYETGRAISCGKIASWGVTLNPGLAAGTYYLMLLTSSSGSPSDGTNVTVGTGNGRLIPGRCIPVVHVGGTAETVSIGEAAANVSFLTMLDVSTGCTIYLSSTGPTSVTGVGSNALFQASGE